MEFIRCHRSNPERFDALKIPCVMRDDERRVSGQSQFQQQIVLGVGQMRPPEKMNSTLDALRQVEVEKVVDVLRSKSWQEPRATKNILILKTEGRRDDGLKLRQAQVL